MPSRRSLLCALPALGSVWTLAAQAQSWPTRAIRFIVPVAPSSGTDLVARQATELLAQRWGSTMVVENQPGAGTVVATNAAARAPADGYTVLFQLSAYFTNPWLTQTQYDPLNDFEPVARLASTALVLVTSVDSPFHTVPDVIDAAKRAPGSINYASAGNGSASHLSGALLAAAANIDIQHTPYRSGAQAMLDTASGEIDIAFSGQAALPLVRANKLRVLAVSAARPSAIMPDAPTINQAIGIDHYDFSSPIWAFVPKGTPAAIVNRLSDGFGEVVASAVFKTFCTKQGFDPDYQSAAAVRAGMAAQVQKWSEVVQLIKA